MSGGIDNIYGAEWEWSIFLSGAVTPLAKLHHGQLPQQTPSFLVLLGTAPHLRGYTDTLDTVLIRQNTARRGGAGIGDLAKEEKKKKNYRCDVCVCLESWVGGWILREKRGFKTCLKCKERERKMCVCVVYWVSSYLAGHSPVVVLCVDECRGI